MGLMDFIKGELIEIIEWTDDSRDTLSWRFPDDDKEIKNGAQLIVRESQVAQFVYLVAFSYAFFLKGFTGLAITGGTVVSLFVVMQVTGRIRWADKFALKPSEPPVAELT